MASISMASAVTAATNLRPLPGSDRSITVRVMKSKEKLSIKASLKEWAVGKATLAAVAASMAVPEVAQAAETLTPSLKNFLLSIVAGGAVLGVIAAAVVGVSNFDPVKRS